MSDSSKLSRRERQILDILYSRGEATVLEIQKKLPDPPTPMAIRRMLQILEEKSQVSRRKDGREFIYAPKLGRKSAGKKALAHVIETFFGGSIENALAAHLDRPNQQYTQEELQRMRGLIDAARNREQEKS
ncbi:MAG: BlaI/MecI/CopY family transcriptional regulator [Verrucomicrobiota bacterium]